MPRRGGIVRGACLSDDQRKTLDRSPRESKKPCVRPSSGAAPGKMLPSAYCQTGPRQEDGTHWSRAIAATRPA